MLVQEIPGLAVPDIVILLPAWAIDILDPAVNCKDLLQTAVREVPDVVQTYK